MRITFIAPIGGMGGGSRVIAIYARRLTRMGHEVCVVSPRPPRLPFSYKLKSWFNGTGWPDERAQMISHLDRVGFIHHVIDRDRPVTDRDVPDGDVVIATWWETAEWVARLAPRKGAKAYFIQHHEVFDYLPTERVRATWRMP